MEDGDSKDEADEKRALRPISASSSSLAVGSAPAGQSRVHHIEKLNEIIARYDDLLSEKKIYKDIIKRNITILEGDNDMEYIQSILNNFNNLTDIKERINSIIKQIYPNP